MSRISNVLKHQCPKCEEGTVFKETGSIFLFKIPKMHTKCLVCDHNFEIEPGFFIGAMYVSYALTVLQGLIIFLTAVLIKFSVLQAIGFVAIGIILLSFFNYRFSRVIWMHMFTKKKIIS